LSGIGDLLGVGLPEECTTELKAACYNAEVGISQAERFTILRRLAAIELALGQLAFLPREDGSNRRRTELDRERIEIVAKLSGRA
jgi:hypothetical protein